MFFVTNLIIFILSLTHVIFTNRPFALPLFNPQINIIPTTFIDIFSFFGSVELIFILTGLFIGILLYKRLLYSAMFFGIVSFGGLILNFFLKIIIRRGRPSEARMLSFFGMDIQIESFSFPSGHTMRMTIFLFLIYLVLKWANFSLHTRHVFTGFTLIVLVALSRLTTDAHFLTDVTAAISASFMYVQAASKAFNEKKLKQELHRLFL